jgi:N-methylhydantoinase B
MPSRPIDPAELAIAGALFSSVADEMGVTLGRSAHSPNIKERRDYSCAVFDPRGRLVAQAAHIPVHLGAMPTAVASVLPLAPFHPGDIVILNDPYLGGTHLPDITMVSPVFLPALRKRSAAGSKERLVAFVASRAHHADVGGISPGSMPIAEELTQEGVVIPPVKLYDRGRLNRPLLDLLLRNMRAPGERRGDLDAQIAANRTGETRLREVVQRYGLRRSQQLTHALMDYAEHMTRAAISAVPDGTYAFEDFLDDDGAPISTPGVRFQPDREGGGGPIPIRVRLTISGDRFHADFTGSDPERPSSINAVAAVTRSAVYYVVRCLLDESVPCNDGCFRPVTLTLPERSVVNAGPPRAVAAGNVETSQRITDVVLGALAQALPGLIPAASQGTMNNITIGGHLAFPSPAHGRGAGGEGSYAYYETIAGGAGASPTGDGLDAVHTHMTNTLNTPVEALEMTYPFRFRVTEYAVRPASGGAGLHRGGDGVTRTYEFLSPADVTLITDRRRLPPYGLAGGTPGTPGRNSLLPHTSNLLPPATELPSKIRLTVQPGDRLTIETPGGGGWGPNH